MKITYTNGAVEAKLLPPLSEESPSGI